MLLLLLVIGELVITELAEFYNDFNRQANLPACFLFIIENLNKQLKFFCDIGFLLCMWYNIKVIPYMSAF